MSELDHQQVLLSLLDQVQEDPEEVLADTGLQPVLGKGDEVLDLDESFDLKASRWCAGNSLHIRVSPLLLSTTANSM